MKKRNAPPAPRSTLFLQLIAGGYLLYLAWDLRTTVESPLHIIPIVLFAAIGLALVCLSAWKIYRKEYREAMPPDDESTD